MNGPVVNKVIFAARCLLLSSRQLRRQNQSPSTRLEDSSRFTYRFLSNAVLPIRLWIVISIVLVYMFLRYHFDETTAKQRLLVGKIGWHDPQVPGNDCRAGPWLAN